MGLVFSPDEQNGLVLRMFLEIYEHRRVSLSIRLNMLIHCSDIENNKSVLSCNFEAYYNNFYGLEKHPWLHHDRCFPKARPLHCRGLREP